MIENLEKAKRPIVEQLEKTISTACHDINRQYKCVNCPYGKICEDINELVIALMNKGLY